MSLKLKSKLPKVNFSQTILTMTKKGEKENLPHTINISTVNKKKHFYIHLPNKINMEIKLTPKKMKSLVLSINTINQIPTKISLRRKEASKYRYSLRAIKHKVSTLTSLAMTATQEEQSRSNNRTQAR